MDFGRLPENELSMASLSLLAEPGINKKLLSNRTVKHPKIYIGCAKRGKPEWLGKLYPLKTNERHLLQHYIQHYNSIELNATHYKIHGPAAISKWQQKTKGIDFKFFPKNV